MGTMAIQDTTCTSVLPMLSPATVITTDQALPITDTALPLMSAAPSLAIQDTTCTSVRPMPSPATATDMATATVPGLMSVAPSTDTQDTDTNTTINSVKSFECKCTKRSCDFKTSLVCPRPSSQHTSQCRKTKMQSHPLHCYFRILPKLHQLKMLVLAICSR